MYMLRKMKNVFFVIILISVFEFGYSQNQNAGYNYANGNGTIISQTAKYGNLIIIRKHEQRFSVYPGTENYITAYDDPNINSRKLFILNNGDYVNTLQVAFIKNLSTGISSNWIKIKTDDNKTGWLDMDDAWDRYADGIWAILEIINVNNRKWTIRKLHGGLTIYTVLNVRNEPGVNGTDVLFQINGNSRKAIPVTILAITEEPDVIDGKNDYWVKIKDENDRIGWIFGGYADVDRGGPKYRTPDELISFNFNLP